MLSLRMANHPYLCLIVVKLIQNFVGLSYGLPFALVARNEEALEIGNQMVLGHARLLGVLDVKPFVLLPFAAAIHHFLES